VADAEAVAGLLAELGYPMSVGDAANRVRAFADTPGHIMLVVEIDRCAVAFLAGHIAELAGAVARYGVVSSLAVTEARRRQGLGTRLLEAFEAWVRDQGGKLVRVTARAHRTEDAHRFYPAIGYEKTGYRFEKRLT